MKNQEDSVSKDYKEKYNIGYIYSKAHPDLSLKIIEQNKTEASQDKPISGLIAGMKEFIDGQEKDLRLNDLNDLRNPQGRENNLDIDR